MLKISCLFLFVFSTQFTTSSQLISCFSCANCDDSQEKVLCGINDVYCLKFHMYFLDYVTHKGCAPDCSPENVDHVFKLSCCTESGCNGSSTKTTNIDTFLLLLFILSVNIYFFTNSLIFVNNV